MIYTPTENEKREIENLGYTVMEYKRMMKKNQKIFPIAVEKLSIAIRKISEVISDAIELYFILVE